MGCTTKFPFYVFSTSPRQGAPQIIAVNGRRRLKSVQISQNQCHLRAKKTTTLTNSFLVFLTVKSHLQPQMSKNINSLF
jgi:hypothetical protein